MTLEFILLNDLVCGYLDDLLISMNFSKVSNHGNTVYLTIIHLMHSITLLGTPDEITGEHHAKVIRLCGSSSGIEVICIMASSSGAASTNMD